jgi:hypothetical protein
LEVLLYFPLLSAEFEDKSQILVYPKVILLGDSLVSRSFSPEMGWGAMIADRFKRKVDVVVRGFSGYTAGMVSDSVQMLRSNFGHPVAAVVVLVGTYDVVAALDKQTMDDYEEALLEIIYLFQVGGSSAILACARSGLGSRRDV